jgi:photosystem II stability/assembly factor-like uncharacterized protein
MRALTRMTLSILAISVVGIVYLHPTVWLGTAPSASSGRADIATGSYQLAAVDFVTPTDGWVVAELQPGRFAILNTTDAGEHWRRQLTGPASGIGEYERFFDAEHGVLVALGPGGILYQTGDGGRTWSRQALTVGDGYMLSADFVDANHGWLLAQASTVGESLVRTEDGGRTWVGLGNPVLDQDWAYRVVFADSSDGWLYSQSAGPYAYRSADAGTTWRRIPLPAPGGASHVAPASISTEKFFVAVHPTEDDGLTASVIGGAPLAIAFQLSSADAGLSWHTISPPSTDGAVGYIDALNWWWIGSGAQSTSSDAGRTWTPIHTVGVPQPLPGSLQMIDATHARFGAMAGSRPLVEATDDGGLNWRMILLPAIAPT